MDPFMGQILTVGFNYAPQGWLTCSGQQLPIQQYAALYSLMGTTFGGNGTQTFALPNLSGRVTVGTGQGTGLSVYQWGQMAGTETVTLTQAQMPMHSHAAVFSGAGSSFSASASAQGDTAAPAANSVLGRGTDINPVGNAKPAIYAPAGSTADTQLAGLNVAGTVTVQMAGGSSPVSLLSPYLALTQIIAVQGIWPSRP